jgi:hypothetical protein
LLTTGFKRPVSSIPSTQSSEQNLLSLDPGSTRVGVPSTLPVSNSISSLIRGKSAAPGNSRLKMIAQSINLEQSRDDLIAELSSKVKQEFDKSQANNFSSKYFYFDTDKLGEGAHASVYKCYLLKDREKVEEYYDRLKALGFETKDCVESAVSLFERAKDNDELT